ncbi:Nif3-like dinuclear metal center hexameric protein [Alteromonas sediminis]|uniref:GTP cyclohydrolase 1 type 2 homolog n=1 Tax=Alteromonas sediminis TaxID=2259342 RepID=A0A3N5Y176_9ALTE|nr:Nif3-like dinuclear metal center hexameric protein [Alteromonas sediminis]RPJ67557.1 Nif3-like dinuclear metal center hexameric protein [Alteromonas sediminis]
MSLKRNQLLNILNDFLSPQEIKDYCPNGLQVEGTDTISHIVTGVTASQALIDRAIALNADTILVHHGYFWKGEAPVITGMKRSRFKALLENNINLFAYHLPLDVHAEVGNNVQLGQLLNVNAIKPLNSIKPQGLVYTGEVDTCEPVDVKTRLESTLGRSVLMEPGNRSITTLAWCTGGGQGYIEAAAEAGIDGFISGEVSEQTIHVAREMGISFFSAGHHATERYGVKALGEWLTAQTGVAVSFVDIDNPA